MNTFPVRSHYQIFLFLLRYFSSITETPALKDAIASFDEFDPQWLELLRLRFEHGYNDLAIAKKMGLTDRTIRNYWARIRHALNISNHPDEDVKVLIQLKARQLGLID